MFHFENIVNTCITAVCKKRSRCSNNAALQQTFIMLFTSNFDDNISKIIC